MLLRKYFMYTVVIFLFLVPIVVEATNLRGRIDGINQYSTIPYPLGGITVDLYVQQPSGWQQIGRYITGSDGMYFFQGIYPGPYTIQVNGRQNYPIMVFNQPYQDLAPILIRY